jgi:hypothetical protein
MSTDRPVMRLQGVGYVEAQAPDPGYHPDGVCFFCALLRKDACASAVHGAAAEVFGGDCQKRDVIYVRAAAALART